MDFLSPLVDIGLNLWQNKENKKAASRQSQADYANNAALQNSAQSFNKNMYSQSWSDQKEENRWLWEQQKEEARFWARNGKRYEVDALRKAGLNPILAAGGLGGSSARSIFMPGSSNNRTASVGTGSSNAKTYHNEISLRKNIAELKLMEKQGESTDAQAEYWRQKSGEVAATKIGKVVDNSAKTFDLTKNKSDNWYRNSKTYKYIVSPIKTIFSGVPKPQYKLGK